MQQKNTLTNKDRLIYGGRVIYTLIWAMVTIITCAHVITVGNTFLKVVAALALILTGIAVFKAMKKIWDEA